MKYISLEEFADRLHEIMPVIIKEFARRQVNELYKGRITLQQFLILEFLYRSGKSNMSALAKFLRVTTANITGIVDRLVRNGYIIRSSDEKDRRVINIKLSVKGSDLVRKVNDERRRLIIKIFGKISERDRQEYLRILTQIKDILLKPEK